MSGIFQQIYNFNVKKSNQNNKIASNNAIIYFKTLKNGATPKLFPLNYRHNLYLRTVTCRRTFVSSKRTTHSATDTTGQNALTIHTTFHEIIYGKPAGRKRAARFFFAQSNWLGQRFRIKKADSFWP
jgi:hypothetical protein